MPLYEYQCQNCNHQAEKLESIHAERMQLCPACQQVTLQRIVSNTHFQLKGNGWYVTDFKNKQASPNNSTETKDNPEKHSTQKNQKQGKNQQKCHKSSPTSNTEPTHKKNKPTVKAAKNSNTTSDKSTTN